MHQYGRNWIAVLLMTCMAYSAFAVMDAPTIEREKNQILGNVLGEQYTRNSKNPAFARVENANALLNFNWTKNSDVDTLRIEVTGVPQCNTFSLDGGKRIVVDLENTINLKSGQKVDVDGQQMVTGIRTSLFAYEPTFVSRVALDLQEPSQFRVERSGSKITIHLSTKGNITDLLSRNEATDYEEATTVARIEIVAVEAAPRIKRLIVAEKGKAKAQAQKLFNQLNSLAVQAPAEGETQAQLVAGQPSATATKSNISAESTQFANAERIYGNTRRATIKTGMAKRIEPETKQLRNSRSARLTDELKAVSAAKINIATSLQGLDADAAPSEEIEVITAKTVRESRAQRKVVPLFLAQAEESDTAPPANDDTTEEETTSDPTPPTPRTDASQDAETAVEYNADANRSFVNQINTLMDELSAPTDNAPDSGATGAGNDEMETIQASNSEPSVSLVPPPYQGDPMEQPVTLSFKNEEVGVVVAVLKYMADINLITGVDMSKKVTLELQDVPLRQAMETTLRMANLGIIEEEGIYQILDYKDAVKVDREQRIIPLENAKATDVQTILEATIVGTLHGDQIKVTANEAGQLVVISAPRERMSELVDLVRQLDIAQPKSPTVTEAIQLNFADPAIIAPSIQNLLSTEGTATPNAETRHIIIKDLPVVVEQVRHLIAKLDIAVKRVAIDSMLVDVSLSDDADTGVDWVLNAVQKQNRRETNLGLPGSVSGNLQNLGMVSPLGFNPGTLPGLAFGVLGKNVDLRGLIQAEIRLRNGRLISNPQLVTIENNAATLEIAQEIPFIELNSSDAGGQQTTTKFKKVGTVLTVTPRVTHDNQIIANLNVKESDTVGEFNGVPIEDQRTILTTVRMHDGETVFMAGARKSDNDATVRKVPILGDIPVVNFLFRQNARTESTRELLVFLTCSVISDDEQITPYQEEQFEDASQIEIKVDGQRSLFHDMVHPDEMRDPPWKWRRTD